MASNSIFEGTLEPWKNGIVAPVDNRSALRAIMKLSHISGAGTSKTFGPQVVGVIIRPTHNRTGISLVDELIK